ncbi:glycosyltransferase [Hoyosella sp. YIM 151337]|uniref:glycosyltransferase family 2 protein n=1 Tax=Hoyosella sp. YIM 151337 TaxID=2992742 RepID=UPI0022360E97|nr:glycosyltransferase [Hoyosella sp. YIM 151337]MCW4355514.1 glycosyltransferase [Hoyosella sp. YIM 151337]
MARPRISVVIMTHNRKDELDRTLRHMIGLGEAPIFVVDNGSSDGTPEFVARAYPEAQLIALPDNRGAVARNIAVNEVRTPYVAFCDDDTCWDPGSLTRAADLLDAYPGLSSVTGRCLVGEAATEDPITPEMRDSPVPAPAWLPGPALLGIMAGLTAVRVEAFRGAGGFHPRFWLGGEEELLALDFARAGWWMVWNPDVTIRHYPSRSRDARRRRQLGIRNTLWTLWLRRPVRSALRRSAAILSSAPRDRATVAALAEALRGAGWVWRERAVVPPDVENGLVLLEESQRRSKARRYVG